MGVTLLRAGSDSLRQDGQQLTPNRLTARLRCQTSHQKCGGDKSTQQKDIEKAHDLAEEWRADRQKEAEGKP